MNIFAEFSRRAPNRVLASIVLGAMSGIGYSLLIPLILSVLRTGDARFEEVAALEPTQILGFEVSDAPLAMLFAGACLLIMISRTLSQVLLTRVAIDVSSDLRRRLYQRISSAPVFALERIGAPKLIVALTTDVPRIVTGARLIPDLLINTVTLLGMLGFLLVLNADVFWFVLGCIAFGLVTYQVPIMFGRRYFIRARTSFDGLQRSIHGLIHGIKELKLNDRKREAYFRTILLDYETQVREAEKTGHTVVQTASNYGDLLSFFVIGSIVFIFVNYRVITNQELVGVVMALLYVTAPISMILNFIPTIAVSRVSSQRVQQLLKEIPSEEISAEQQSIQSWDCVRFCSTSYQYEIEGKGFQAGPFDLEFPRGAITLIVGGNGSGKSTLAKLLTLHYHPDQGDIYFGDQLISPSNIGTYRQQISAIYANYHLFDQVLGVATKDLTATVNHYLEALQLTDKVTFRDGKFSTLALSDGQRRRMALLVAMIDDKDLYVFDEWAADQDPEFKEFFYNRILPDLKSKGKAVVAITHDDRFFHLADQLIVVSEGKVKSVVRKDQEGLTDKKSA